MKWPHPAEERLGTAEGITGRVSLSGFSLLIDCVPEIDRLSILFPDQNKVYLLSAAT